MGKQNETIPTSFGTINTGLNNEVADEKMYSCNRDHFG